jgi:hypothetical protein
MRNAGVSWALMIVVVAGCGAKDSDGGRDDPGLQGGGGPNGSVSKLTSFAVAADIFPESYRCLPPCLKKMLVLTTPHDFVVRLGVQHRPEPESDSHFGQAPVAPCPLIQVRTPFPKSRAFVCSVLLRTCS